MNVLQKFKMKKNLKTSTNFPSKFKETKTHQWIKLRMNSIFDQKHKQTL